MTHNPVIFVQSAKQQGVALLVAMMMLLSGSAVFLINQHGNNRADITDNRLQALLSAKQALIAYAVNYADNYGHNTRGGPGRLPCPSLQRHGSPARSCRTNAIGFLPSVWSRDNRQMEIDYLERFLDQDIWYAVSADHRFNPAFNHLNSYPGSNPLTVDTVNDVVAVLIAPGQALSGQQRNYADGITPAAMINSYLEGENADADSDFTITNPNDIVVTIRRDELIPFMERRVLGHVKQWLIDYKADNGFYPYAAALGNDGQCSIGVTRGMLATGIGTCINQVLLDVAFDDLPAGRTLRQTWFANYEWPGLIYYIVDDSCTPARGVADCDNIDDPERQLRVDGEPVELVVISVGAPIVTAAAAGLQDRSNPALENYLDTAELLFDSNEFSTTPVAADNNDQLVFIN